MGGTKSKPKEPSQRSRSLDDGTGGQHHSPNQSVLHSPTGVHRWTAPDAAPSPTSSTRSRRCLEAWTRTKASRLLTGLARFLVMQLRITVLTLLLLLTFGIIVLTDMSQDIWRVNWLNSFVQENLPFIRYSAFQNTYFLCKLGSL